MLSVAPVPEVGVTLLVLALWLIQGSGWVRWLMPSLREHALAEWVSATWLGALVSLVVAVELHFVIPGATAGQLAWPVTIALAAASLVLYVRSGWTRPRFDALGLGSVAIAALGGRARHRRLRSRQGSGLTGIDYTVVWAGAHLALLGPLVMPPRDMK